MKRTIDTMDEKDWIILRLMRAGVRGNFHSHPDFVKTCLWLHDNIEDMGFSSRSSFGLAEALKADEAHRRPIDLYLSQNWNISTDNAQSCMENHVMSVMNNDND